MAQLDPRDIESIAERVVELLDQARREQGLVSAVELARRLGVARSTVYERADELGAIRIGTGPRARLRFDPQVVRDRLSMPGAGMDRQPAAAPRLRQRRISRPTSDTDLLPIRGRGPR